MGRCFNIYIHILSCIVQEILGDSWRFLEIPWDSLNGGGVFEGFLKILWDVWPISVGFRWECFWFLGILWDSLRFFEILWESLEFLGIFRDFLEFFGILLDYLQFLRILGNFMGFFKIFWNFWLVFRILWDSPLIEKNQSEGFLGILCDL